MGRITLLLLLVIQGGFAEEFYCYSKEGLTRSNPYEIHIMDNDNSFDFIQTDKLLAVSAFEEASINHYEVKKEEKEKEINFIVEQATDTVYVEENSTISLVIDKASLKKREGIMSYTGTINMLESDEEEAISIEAICEIE